MNDFEAPKLDDTAAPRMFRTITSKSVSYDMDFVQYLIGQEQTRRQERQERQMTAGEAQEFQRQLVAKLIIRGDATAAIALRPAPEERHRSQLNG